MADPILFVPFFCGACQQMHAPDDAPACRHCHFYSTHSTCRRLPPTVGDGRFAVWPIIPDPWRDWCGEYRVHGIQEARDE